MHCYGYHLVDGLHEAVLSCLGTVGLVSAVQTVVLTALLASQSVLHDKHICINICNVS